MNAIFTALASAVLVLGAAEAQTAAQQHGSPQGSPPPFLLPSAPAPQIGGPNHQDFPGQLPNRLVMTPNGELERVGPTRHTFDSSDIAGGSEVTRFHGDLVPEHGGSPGPSYRRWTAGEHLPPSAGHEITRYSLYGLTPPSPGTVWVRSGPDALLVNRSSGEIIRAQYGLFH